MGINTIYNSSLDKNIDTNSEYYQKNFCITGSFDIPRDQIKNMLIKKFDANVTSSVNKTTNYLIAGENAGSKIEKAKELGITIINNKYISIISFVCAYTRARARTTKTR